MTVPSPSTTPTPPPQSPDPSPQTPPPHEKPSPLFQLATQRRNDVADFLRHAADPQTPLDPDFVHDLRVSLRRLSELAALLATLLDKTSARAVEQSLKSLRQAAGDLRDLDVTTQHLQKWRMPAPLKKAARQLIDREHARRPDLEAALRTTATSATLAATLVLLARLLEEQSKPDCLPAASARLEKELDKRIAQRRKKLKKAFAQAARKQSPQSLHEARIAAKKLRYSLEIEKELNDKKHKKELKFLKSLQQLLGDHHDTHVIEVTLQQQLPPHHPTPIKSLRPAWRKWHRDMEKKQAHRAATFFIQTYTWMNH
ncbi:MAG: CHAD domain-containing protein [Phycisphaerae bacterium]